MIQKDAFLKKVFYAASILLLSGFLYPQSLLAQAINNLDRVIKIKDNLISATAYDEETFNILKDTEILDVLKKIERETGVKMTVNTNLTGKKMTREFANLDVESAVRRILGNTYYIFLYSQGPLNNGKTILREVRVEDENIGSIPIKGKVTSIEIPYGAGTGEVGSFIGTEGSSGGPQSFAVDDDGNIYICDSLNKRIQVFSSDGTYLYTIPLRKETLAGDIAVDIFGFIYIYDGHIRKLFQYDKKGNVVTGIGLDNSMVNMQIIDNEIYTRNYINDRETDVIIGRIVSGRRLIKPSVEEMRKHFDMGELGISGRRYKGKDYGDRYGRELTEKDGRKSMVVFFPPRKDITVGPSLGEDKQGNLYFTNSRDEDKFRLFNIDKFNLEGKYVGTYQIPGGDHFFSTTRHFYLSKDGNIYHFIPEKEKLRIYILFPGK